MAKAKTATKSTESTAAGAADATATTTPAAKISSAKTPEQIAADEQKKAAAAQAKADKEAEAATKRAEKVAAAEAKKAERQAKIDALAAEGKSTNTSMLSLTDKVKSGVYVKGATGQFRSNDELAQAFDAVPPINVVATALELLGLESNPYPQLNAGQQSMNLRNKLRKAIKLNTVTIDQVVKCIETHGYATAGVERAAKQAAKDEKAAAKFAEFEAKAKAKADKLAAAEADKLQVAV